MEQEPIDVAHATPVPGAKKRGMNIWLQLLISLVIIAIAFAGFVLFFPGAHESLARYGINLPQLAQTPAAAAPAPAETQGGQRQAQAGQAAPAGQPAAQGAPAGAGGGARPGGQGGGFGGANRTATVVAEPATSGTINNKLSAIGEGSAMSAVTVSSASGGTLVSVDVKPGDKVEKGARIATLDSDTQQNALDRAKLALTDADATLARTQSLVSSNSAPASQLDAAKLADDTAKLAVQAAQIALDQRTITTPIAGAVGLIQVSPGNLINAQTVVTTVEDSSSILINFWIPERYASQMAVGLPVNVESVALAGNAYSGTVTAIDNKIDPASRTLQVQATLPNPDGAIRAGMSFSVEMDFPGETYPSVDPLSIQWSNSGAYVWKITDAKVHKAMVEIIQRNSDGVLVKGDVATGDEIVTQGVLQLTEGAAIRILGAPAEGEAGAAAGQGQSGGQRQGGGQGQAGRQGQGAPATQPPAQGR